MSHEKAFVSETYNGVYWSSTYRHLDSLKDSVRDISVKEFDTAIRLALSAIQNMNQASGTLQYKEALASEMRRQAAAFETEKEDACSRLQAESSRIEKELRARIARLESQIASSDETAARIREQLQNSDEAIVKAVREKEAQYERELARHIENYKGMIERIEQGARERVESVRVLYQEQEEKLRRQVEKSLVSSERGKQGEKEFEELAAQLTTWGPLSNTSKTAHSTDLFGRIRGCPVMFEIKNYTNEVPSAEVTKFERDMKEHTEVPYGVFVSLRTGICGKKSEGFMSMKWTERSQLLLYINTFYNHTAEDVMRFIDMYADCARMIYEAARAVPDAGEMAGKLQSQIEAAKVFVEKEVGRMEGFLKKMGMDVQNLKHQVEMQYNQNIYEVSQNIQALRKVLEILLGSAAPVPEAVSEEVVAASEDVVIVPDGEVQKKKKGGKKAVKGV